MRKIISLADLSDSIILLEIKQADEKALLKNQFMVTYESMKPANLIKDKLNDIVTSPNLKGNILNGVLSLVAGYLSKKAIIGSTHNPLKQALGVLLQAGVTSVVSKNTDTIKSTAIQLINSFLTKKIPSHAHSDEND